MSKVPASVGPDNWLKAEERLLKLPCVRDVVAYDAQEQKPSQTSPAVKGNGHACISAKAREKVVVQAIVVLLQLSLQPATFRNVGSWVKELDIVAEFYALDEVERDVSSNKHLK